MSPFTYGYHTLPIYCRTKRALSDWFCGFSLACKTPYYGPPLLGPVPEEDALTLRTGQAVHEALEKYLREPIGAPVPPYFLRHSPEAEELAWKGGKIVGTLVAPAGMFPPNDGEYAWPPEEAEHASYISQIDDGLPVLVDLSGEDRDTLPSCPSWPFPETYSSPPPPPLLKVTLIYCVLILLASWALAHAWYGP